MVLGDDGPAVGQQPYVALAGVHHGFDGERHAGDQFEAATAFAIMQHLRIFVEDSADAVSAILPHDGQVLRLDEALDGRTQIAQAHAGANLTDSGPHRFVGDVDQPLRGRGDLADRVHAAGVAVPAVFDDGDVDIDDVALLEALFRARDAVADDVVHRGAHRLGK